MVFSAILPLALVFATTSCDARTLVNKIMARVNGINILQSECAQAQITSGKPLTLKEAINNELLCQHATAMHLAPSVQDVERNVNEFKRTNNLTELSDKEFDRELRHNNGITLNAYKTQLGRVLAIENVKRAEISEKIIVSNQEVEERYKSTPLFIKEAVCLSVCTISENEMSNVDAFVNSKKADWQELGWIATKDLDSAYKPALKLKAGQISEPIKRDGNYQLVRLVEKRESRLKTLAEAYGTLERKIQNERKGSIMNDLLKSLTDKAVIVKLP